MDPSRAALIDVIMHLLRENPGRLALDPEVGEVDVVRISDDEADLASSSDDEVVVVDCRLNGNLKRRHSESGFQSDLEEADTPKLKRPRDD
jgi:hypothetical protein